MTKTAQLKKVFPEEIRKVLERKYIIIIEQSKDFLFIMIKAVI